MTVSSRVYRSARPVEGPFVATVADVPQLNEVFTEAFTERACKTVFGTGPMGQLVQKR